jgi:predicted amidohydrolase
MAGLDHLQKQAERQKVNLWVGACMNTDGKWFNTAYGFTPNGKTHIYQKINLANHERGVFTPGNHLPVFELITPSGSVMVGVQMCRELRYPEQWGWLARCGVQIFLHLNNAVGDDTFQSVWKSHLVSRAAETQRFVLSANNASSKQISPTIAIAPDGQVCGEIVSPEFGILRVELDLSKASRWYLDQCRSDVVSIQTP